MRNELKLYKVNMKYIRDLQKADDKVLSVSPQAGKSNRVFVGIVVYVAIVNIAFRYHLPKSNIIK